MEFIVENKSYDYINPGCDITSYDNANDDPMCFALDCGTVDV